MPKIPKNILEDFLRDALARTPVEERRFAIKSEDGKRYVIDGWVFGGVLAAGEFPEDSWTVTHLVTGLAVIRELPDYQTAATVACALLPLTDWTYPSPQETSGAGEVRRARDLLQRHFAGPRLDAKAQKDLLAILRTRLSADPLGGMDEMTETEL